MPPPFLKKIRNHPAATYIGEQATVDVDGLEEIQQEIHFDHPSVGQCGVLIRRQLAHGTVKVVAFSMPDRLEWNRCSQRADDVVSFDPTGMLTLMWEEFQNERAD